MKNFTTNMALRDCFHKRADDSSREENVLSKDIKRKLKMIEKAFR